MKDRLAELQSHLREHGENGSYELAEVRVSTGSLASFFNEVDAVRHNVQEIESLTERLASVHRSIHSSANPPQVLRQQAEDIAGQVRTAGMRARQQLKCLSTRLPENSSAVRVRMLGVQEAALGRSLQRALSAFSAEQMRHRDVTRALLQAQLRVARSSLVESGAAEEELERLLDLDQSNVAIFTDHIILHTQEARQALADIEERHLELIKIEKNIKEVRDLFFEMAALVEHQGEMIDRIENHVAGAQNHVDKGRVEIKEANTKKDSARRKKYGLIICLTVSIAILLAVLIFLYL